MSRLKGVSPAAKWTLGIVAIIVILIAYYAVLDRFTPLTGDAFVQAHVVQIAPEVAGPVVDIYVRDNTFVKAGAPLFAIDSRPYTYSVEQLEAKLALAKQQITQYESELDQARAVIDQAAADVKYAEQRFQEVVTLAKKQLAAQRQLDEMIDNRTSKRAALKQSQANEKKVASLLAAKIGDEHALVKEAEAALAQARYDLDRTRILAPVDGYITNLQLVTGSYVTVGRPVMTLVDTEKWWVVGNFRENSVEQIHAGQSARVTLATYPGVIIDARVESVGWGVGEGQGVPSGELPAIESPNVWVKQAQRFPVRLTLSDTAAETPLRIGGSVVVLIYTGDYPVLNTLADLWLRIASVLNFIY
jgi:multidrug resistance efflux pump